MNYRQEDLGVTADLEVIDQILDVQGKFLVEAGCGNMDLSRLLAARGAQVLAIDPDPVQAEKNRNAQTVANVDFMEAGAEAIPVENQSVDGVLFPYSLHHVPAPLYPDVFKELFRVLRPTGFIYAMEPVAAGDLNEVMRLFHDEQTVRTDAKLALESLGMPFFQQVTVVNYRVPVKYDSWEQYAARYAGKSFNADYTVADIRAPEVRARFLALGEPTQFAFESPMQITYLQGPSQIKDATSVYRK